MQLWLLILYIGCILWVMKFVHKFLTIVMPKRKCTLTNKLKKHFPILIERSALFNV